jgi:hypothetical protein
MGRWRNSRKNNVGKMERQQKRLIWVHKIIKQVQGGWKVDMRETTRNSKEATRDKIEAQGKKEARMLDMENSSDWTRKCPRDSDGPEQL